MVKVFRFSPAHDGRPRVCFKCGKELKPNQRIISVFKKGSYEYFHEWCYP